MRRALIVGIDHLDCCHSGALGLIPALQSEQVHLENYRRLLKNAAAVETLDFIQPEEKAFFEAGKRVVALADLVIAVWNGQPAKGLGGTADAVKYALDQKKPVVHINPITRHVPEI